MCIILLHIHFPHQRLKHLGQNELANIQRQRRNNIKKSLYREEVNNRTFIWETIVHVYSESRNQL